MGVDVIESKTKTARKPHRCDYCGEIIEKGEDEVYVRSIKNCNDHPNTIKVRKRAKNEL